VGSERSVRRNNQRKRNRGLYEAERERKRGKDLLVEDSREQTRKIRVNGANCEE
jgi:hypothetical protein